MLFLTFQNSMFELLRDYLVSNSFIKESTTLEVYTNALMRRGQELGFKMVEEYCRYPMLLAYPDMLKEIKSFNLVFQPLSLYQNKDQLNALTSSKITELLQKSDEHTEERDDRSSWLKSVLTKEIKLKSEEEFPTLKALSIETGGGEEAYSAAIRLRSILPENVPVEVTATESESKYYNQAKEGVYNRGKLFNLSDNYRALYFEEITSYRLKVVKSIHESVKALNIDAISYNFSESSVGQYHLVFINNPWRFYPQHIADKLVDKVAPLVAPGGLLFTKMPPAEHNIDRPGLDRIVFNDTAAYKRNSEKLELIEKPFALREKDTIENRMFYCRALFIDGRYEDARKEVDKILNEKIDYLEGNHFRADIDVKLGEYDRAISQYEKTLFINPNFLPARFNCAVLKYLKGKNEEADAEIEKVIQNLDKCDYERLEHSFNFGYGSFVKHCRDLKSIIFEKKTLDLERFQAEMEKDHERKIEAPDIEIPDMYEQKKSFTEEETKTGDSAVESAFLDTAAVPPGERKVVNISELPSSRDYGEHDPWKKKLKQEAERKKREEEERQRRIEAGEILEVEETEVEPAQPVQPAKHKKFEKPEVDIEERRRLLLGGHPIPKKKEERPVTQKAPETAETVQPQQRKPTRVPTRLERPAQALFLEDLDPEKFNLPESLTQKLSEQRRQQAAAKMAQARAEGNVEVEDKPDSPGKKEQPPSTYLLSEKAEKPPQVIKEGGLPEKFIKPIRELIEKKDAKGLVKLLETFQNYSADGEKETLNLMLQVAKVMQKRAATKVQKKRYTGKLKETHDKLREIQDLIQNRNVLEASMKFQEVLSSAPASATLSKRQRERLDGIKAKLESKMERYQKFIDNYYSNPREVFQTEMWEALAHLTPLKSLKQTGIKYGLDPEYLPDKYRI